MPNEIELGFDHESLRREVEKAADIIAQGLSKHISSGFGGVLGNGLPSTQGPQGGGGSVVSILEKLLEATQQGFARLLEASGGGLTKPGPQPPPQQSGGGGGGGPNMGRITGAVGRFANPEMFSMVEKGFRDTAVMGFLTGVLGDVPVLGAALKYSMAQFKNKDEFISEKMDVFRASGEVGRRNYATMIGVRGHDQGDDKSVITERKMRGLGLERKEVLQLQQQAAKQFGGGGSASAIWSLMDMEGQFGMGGAAASLSGTMMRGGARDSKQGQLDPKLFAEVLAVAIGTNLDRGRWGEAFTSMAKAADAVRTGDVDKAQLLAKQNWVGGMGGRFLGDTHSATSMQGMLSGLQQGQGGPTANIMAMRAAGFGQKGVSYQKAWMRVQRGDAAGGVRIQDVLKQLMNRPEVKRYLASGSEDDLENAVFNLSMVMQGYKATDIYEALKELRRSGVPGEPADDLVARMQQDITSGAVPEQSRALIEKERVHGSLKGVGENNMRNFGAAGPDAPTKGRAETLGQVRGEQSRSQAAKESRDAEISRDTRNLEGFGSKDASRGWPMGPGDKQEPGYKPGWRARRESDPAHMGRDIIIGGGKPGESVYAPIDGVWLTGSPVKANAMNAAEGFIGEMRGKNGIRYKFIHLIFDPGLTPQKPIKQGQFIGKVAGGTGKWQPHLHFEAWKPGADGAEEVVDPDTTMSGDQKDIMKEGLRSAKKGVSSVVAPEFRRDESGRLISPSRKTLSGGGDAVAGGPGRQAVDVNIFVHDARISTTTAAGKRGKKEPGRGAG